MLAIRISKSTVKRKGRSLAPGVATSIIRTIGFSKSIEHPNNAHTQKVVKSTVRSRAL